MPSRREDTPFGVIINDNPTDNGDDDWLPISESLIDYGDDFEVPE